MKFLVPVILLFTLGGSTLPDPGVGRAVFGVRIGLVANGQMVSYVGIRYNPTGTVKEERFFTREEFIHVLSGDWPSPYNPTKKNLFEENKIVGGVIFNDTFMKKYTYCPAFDSLWKIRYSGYPTLNGPKEIGWSLGIYTPSLKQTKHLADRYNIKYLDNDYVIDTNFWKLLHDVTDSAWISEYKNLK